MKILPEYLINIMSALEEAAEELRLSVIDHAYDLLNSLDLDELTSDDIRRKLELYDLKVENMTTEWLPNGRFYRLYPSIKHHRSRLNSLKSIVKSGGQFEGLWSADFHNTTNFNYKYIQVMRHYEIKSQYDGYIYVSGDTQMSSDGTVAGSVLSAMSSDILINQAMPAGYTYLYIPWPRPHYPGDAGYFYAVHMLNFDRLHYSKNCDALQPKYYSTDVPASMSYSWSSGEGTPWKTPYWYDYHYMNNMTISASTWPIVESGEYYDINGNVASPENAVEYVLNNNCKELGYSNSVFASKCYILSRNVTTLPNRDLDNPVNESTLFVPNSLDTHGDLLYFTQDSNCPDDITEEISNEPGPYRWDRLIKDVHFDRIHFSHIKTYKPIWSESSPIFAMMQSNFNSGLHPEETAAHSFYNWFELKRQENIKSPEESTIRDNNPPISEITYTSFDRPTGAYISPLSVAYTRALNDNQGYNKVVTDEITDNLLYEPGSLLSSLYNPEFQYKLVSLNSDADGSQIQYTDNISMLLEGDPSTGSLFLNKCTDTGHSQDNSYNYVTYRTSLIHKMWFSSSKQDTHIDSLNSLLYNDVSTNNIYHSNRIKKMTYSLVGLYDSDNHEVNLDCIKEFSQVHLGDDEYGISFSAHRVYAALQIEYDQNEWIVADRNEDNNANLGDNYFYFKSNSISHGQSTMMLASIIAEAVTTINYSIKNDSEYNCDYIHVLLDDVEIETAQFHDNEWVNFNVNLTKGQHIIKFIYTKDGADSSGADAGYIAISKDFIDEDTLTYVEIADDPVEFTASYILFTAKATGEFLPVPPAPPTSLNLFNSLDLQTGKDTEMSVPVLSVIQRKGSMMQGSQDLYETNYPSIEFIDL